MIYDFWCECGGRATADGSFDAPPPPPFCSCGQQMHRDFGGICIDTSGCKDHDEVPFKARVTQETLTGVSASRGNAIERAYAADIAAKRKANKQSGKKGTMTMSHSIPTELYFGKIKETGDKAYWQSPKNLNRHKSTKVI